MKHKKLSKQDWSRVQGCIESTIASQSKIINQRVQTYSTQSCWAIAEEMCENFKLLDKVKELCGEEEECES